jgi:hypothetical protein
MIPAMSSIRLSVLFAIVLILPASLFAQEKHWYKGNLHTHTLWSDGDGFPEMSADWYKTHAYDFLALSDHNVLSIGEKWMAVRDVEKNGGEIAMRNYRARFGNVVKTRHSETNGEEVQLQPLEKVRQLLEEPGKFILIPAEEISDKLGDKPVHMGAINVGEVIKPKGGKSIREVITNNFEAVAAQEKKLGRPMVAHLNHPNFRWGVTPEELADAIEARYVEVYNGHPVANHLGDANHPGAEKVWDIANAIRLAQLRGESLMGVATDDTHNYHVTGMSRATAGRGWVMVHATALTPDAITRGLKEGDFYGSSGVTLKSISFDPTTKTLSLEIAPDGAATFTTEFIGTPRSFSADGKTPLNSADVGKVFATASGTKAVYRLTGDELYVRARVTSSKPATNPSYEQQKQQAWTQPVTAPSPSPSR